MIRPGEYAYKKYSSEENRFAASRPIFLFNSIFGNIK